jgi:hypothetical protein
VWSATAALSAGWAIAVPIPSRIALTRPAASGRGSRTSTAGNAAAWTIIPVTIIGLRPTVSASRPVNS